MKALVQRVSEARVRVEGEVFADIGAGTPRAAGWSRAGDGEGRGPEHLSGKIARLRIFADESAKMNRSLLDTGGSALVVSQFTLCADLSRGNRPGFSRAAAPEVAEALYAHFCAALAGHGVPVEHGRFAAHMEVGLVNDGPVTIWLDTGAG